MAYLTTTQLTTIKQEINILLSANYKLLIEAYKNTGTLQNEYQYNLLAIAHEIILPFEAVVVTTDSIINNISDADLQILVGKIYTKFPTLKYPN